MVGAQCLFLFCHVNDDVQKDTGRTISRFRVFPDVKSKDIPGCNETENVKMANPYADVLMMWIESGSSIKMPISLGYVAWIHQLPPRPQISTTHHPAYGRVGV